MRLKYADVLIQLERYDQGLAQLALAEKIATSDEESEAVLERQIKAYQGRNQLKARPRDSASGTDAGRGSHGGPAGSGLRVTSKSEQQLADTATAVRRAIEVDPKSVLLALVAGRPGSSRWAAISRRPRQLLQAELTVLDRRARSEYLASLAKLEARLGRREQALAAGRELLAAAPGNNIDSYQTFADLCFQLGEVEEGLEALRRFQVRPTPPTPRSPRTRVGQALARNRFLHGAEAGRVVLAFRPKRPSDLDGKFSTVARLIGLYLQRNQFDRLVARLERLRQDPETQREGSLCTSPGLHIFRGSRYGPPRA